MQAVGRRRNAIMPYKTDLESKENEGFSKGSDFDDDVDVDLQFQFASIPKTKTHSKELENVRIKAYERNQLIN